MQCKQCGYKFHYCNSCGYDGDLHPLSEGYCSWKCMTAATGYTLDQWYDDED